MTSWDSCYRGWGSFLGLGAAAVVLLHVLVVVLLYVQPLEDEAGGNGRHRTFLLGTSQTVSSSGTCETG